MTSRGDGTCTVRNTRPFGVSSMPLLPLRICLSISSLSGSLPTSAAFTSRCSPLATSVTMTAARRAARSAFKRLENIEAQLSSPSRHSVRETGRISHRRRIPAFSACRFRSVDRFGDDGTRAATRYRAEEIALVVDHQIGADRTRRRAPSLNHGGERDTTPVLAPVFCRFEDVVFARHAPSHRATPRS